MITIKDNQLVKVLTAKGEYHYARIDDVFSSSNVFYVTCPTIFLAFNAFDLYTLKDTEGNSIKSITKEDKLKILIGDIKL